MKKQKRLSFDCVPGGYVESRNVSNRPPTETALPEEAKVTSPGERAEFLKRKLQEATRTGSYVTVPDLADERLGDIEISTTSRRRMQKHIRLWLSKARDRGEVEHVKRLIGVEHQGTDGWRWNPAKLEGADG